MVSACLATAATKPPPPCTRDACVALFIPSTYVGGLPPLTAATTVAYVVALRSLRLLCALAWEMVVCGLRHGHTRHVACCRHRTHRAAQHATDHHPLCGQAVPTHRHCDSCAHCPVLKPRACLCVGDGVCSCAKTSVSWQTCNPAKPRTATGRTRATRGVHVDLPDSCCRKPLRCQSVQCSSDTPACLVWSASLSWCASACAASLRHGPSLSKNAVIFVFCFSNKQSIGLCARRVCMPAPTFIIILCVPFDQKCTKPPRFRQCPLGRGPSCASFASHVSNVQ